MKMQELGRRLDALAVILGDSRPQMLERLLALADLLKASTAANIAQFSKALQAQTPESTDDGSAVTCADAAAALSTVLEIAEQLDAKKAAADLSGLQDLLSAPPLRGVAIARLLDGLKAPKRRSAARPRAEGGAARSRAADQLREEVVAGYLKELNAALGLPAFEDVYDRLAKDKRVRGAEMAAIASEFVSQTSKSAKKGDSLQRIRSRHDNLVDARQKDRVLSAMARR